MPKVYLSLGSNQGDRRKNLEMALQAIQKITNAASLRVSSIYQSPAMLPLQAPTSWNIPFWNIVAAIDTQELPETLLMQLKKIERDLGRTQSERWSPRPIDIDILYAEGMRIESDLLKIPHPGITERAFVLDPLAELAPDLVLPDGLTVRQKQKKHPQHQPRLMGILNLSPDSFSNTASDSCQQNILATLADWSETAIAIVDIGGESTRPGAHTIDVTEEWQRIQPILSASQELFHKKILKPKLSVDTRNAETAAKAIELGASIINDVSALSDPEMIPLLQSSTCHYVLMHSLTVPADPRVTLSTQERASTQLLAWFETKLNALTKAGITKNRLILDPGIGFGKTSLQSLELLRALPELLQFELPLLVAHSRKSFFTDFSAAPAAARDTETLAVSLALVNKGADILRVHNPQLHQRALLAWSHIQ